MSNQNEADLKVSRMPSVQVGALAASNFAQAVMLTLPFTVGVYAVRDWFPGSGEELVGQRTGLLAAAYALSQTLTGYAWGTWSSKHGRKPVMLLGNAASAVSLVWFGLAGSYASAAAARAVAGLLNAIIVAFKCMVGESCDALEQGRVMSLMTLSWGIGCVVGPLIGGAFSRPCDLWPKGHGPLGSLCDPDGLFVHRPYLLPCLLAAAFNAASFFANIFILKETLPAIVLRRREGKFAAAAHSYPDKPKAAPAAVAGGVASSTGSGSGGWQSLPAWWRRWAARYRTGGAAVGGYARLRAVSITVAAQEDAGEKAAVVTELARFDSAADMVAAKQRLLLKGNSSSFCKGSSTLGKANSGGDGDSGGDSGGERFVEQQDTQERRDCGNGGGVGVDCDVRVQRIDSEWLLRSYRRPVVKEEDGTAAAAGSFCDNNSSSRGGASSSGSDGEPDPGSPAAEVFSGANISGGCVNRSEEEEEATQRLLPLDAAANRSDSCCNPAKTGLSKYTTAAAGGAAVAAAAASPGACDASSSSSGGSGSQQWWRDRRVVLSLLGYGCVCLVFILIDEVVPIFASAPVEEGGLQMAEADLSAPLAAGGLTLITFTLLGYPPLQRIFGTLPLTRAGLALAALAAAAAPLSSLAAGAGVRVTGALLATALALKNIAHCCAFNGAMVVLNVVCDPAQLGAVNGAGQTLASLVRGLGPLAGGALWGAATRAPAGGQFGVFGSIAAVAAAALRPFCALRVDACERPMQRRHASGASPVATEEA